MQSFKQVRWRRPDGGWRYGQVGEANVERAEVWPFNDDAKPIVFTGPELDELQAKPTARPLSTHSNRPRQRS